MFGLGLSAAVSDADGAGYLGPQESAGAEQLRGEYRSWCLGLAAELLSRFGEPGPAKQTAQSCFEILGTKTDTGRLNDEEVGLVDRFTHALDHAIDQVSEKPDWQRMLLKWGFRTPRFVKVSVAIVIVFAIVIPLIVWVKPK